MWQKISDAVQPSTGDLFASAPSHTQNSNQTAIKIEPTPEEAPPLIPPAAAREKQNSFKRPSFVNRW
jgi:hypothetical protein